MRWMYFVYEGPDRRSLNFPSSLQLIKGLLSNREDLSEKKNQKNSWPSKVGASMHQPTQMKALSTVILVAILAAPSIVSFLSTQVI